MEKDTYIVELRVHDDEGDYSENDYDFDNREDAVNFAKENRGDLHNIYFYEAGTNSNPRTINI